MNLTKMLLNTRKFLVAAAVTAVAATCVASGNPVDAIANHTKPALNQATKEWKIAPSSTKEVVLATKEWKVDPLKTKEW
jgi:nitrous oxide reductase